MGYDENQLISITTTANACRTPAALHDLCRQLLERGAVDYASTADAVIADTVQNGIYVGDRKSAAIAGLSFSTMRARRLKGTFPASDVIGPNRIAVNRISLAAWQIQVCAMNDLLNADKTAA